MTALKFYINDDKAHEWHDLRHYHSIVPAVLQCTTSYLVTFCMNYESTGAIIDDVVIEYIDESELALDDTSVFDIYSDGERDWIVYNEDEVESGGAPLEPGLARLRIEMSNGDKFYSDYFQICDINTSSDGDRLYYDDYFNIYFSSVCDFRAKYRILYHTGYENHHAFDSKPIRPDNNYSSDGEIDEAQNEFVELQSNKKIYRVEIIGGESLFDMLAVLPLHDNIHVRWPGEEMQTAYNVEFEYDWVDDYLCRMIIKFSLVNLKKGTCDTDFELIDNFEFKFSSMLTPSLIRNEEGDNLSESGTTTLIEIIDKAGNILTLNTLPENLINEDIDWFAMSLDAGDFNGGADPSYEGDYTAQEKITDFDFINKKITIVDATDFDIGENIAIYSPWANYEFQPGQETEGIITIGAGEPAWKNANNSAGPSWYDEENSRFILLFGGHDGSNYQTGFAYSPDAENWTLGNSGNPIIENGDDADFSTHVQPTGNAIDLGNGKMAFVLNGYDGSNWNIYYCECDKNDPASGLSWTKITNTTNEFGGGFVFFDSKYHLLTSTMGSPVENRYNRHYTCVTIDGTYSLLANMWTNEYNNKDSHWLEGHSTNCVPFVENNKLYAIIGGTQRYLISAIRGNRVIGGLMIYSGGSWSVVNDFAPEFIFPMYFYNIPSEDYGWAGGHSGGYTSWIYHDGTTYFFCGFLRLRNTYQVACLKLIDRT